MNPSFSCYSLVWITPLLVTSFSLLFFTNFLLDTLFFFLRYPSYFSLAPSLNLLLEERNENETRATSLSNSHVFFLALLLRLDLLLSSTLSDTFPLAFYFLNWCVI